MVKKLLAENIIGGMTDIPSTIRTTVTKEVTTTETGERKVSITGSFTVDEDVNKNSIDDVVSTTKELTDMVSDSVEDEEIARISNLAGVPDITPTIEPTQMSMSDDLALINDYMPEPTEDEIEDDLETLEDDMGLNEATIDVILSPELQRREKTHNEASKNIIKTPNELDDLIKKTIKSGHHNTNIVFKKNVGGAVYTARIRNSKLANIETPYGDTVTNINDIFETLSESNEDKKLLCPECGEEVWDKAEGYKLNKCWNCKTAFDNIEDEEDEDYNSVKRELEPGEELLMEIPDDTYDIEVLSSADVDDMPFVGKINNIDSNLLTKKFGKPEHKYDDNMSYDIAWYANINGNDVIIRNNKEYDRKTEFKDNGTWFVYSKENVMPYVITMIFDRPVMESVEEIAQTVKTTVKEAYNTLHNVYKTVLRTDIECDVSLLTSTIKSLTKFLETIPVTLDENNKPDFKMWHDDSIKKGNNQPEDKKFKTCISKK